MSTEAALMLTSTVITNSETSAAQRQVPTGTPAIGGNLPEAVPFSFRHCHGLEKPSGHFYKVDWELLPVLFSFIQQVGAEVRVPVACPTSRRGYVCPATKGAVGPL